MHTQLVSTSRSRNFLHHCLQISKAQKVPSAWLRLLCSDWASTNGHIVAATNLKLLEYKPYLKGQLSSQLLCRLSIPEQAKEFDIPDALNFWKILGIIDDFDRAYIISQIERFCILYSIRANFTDDDLLDPAPAEDVGLSVRPEDVAAMRDLSQAVTHYAVNASTEVRTHYSPLLFSATFHFSVISLTQINFTPHTLGKYHIESLHLERR